MTTAQNSGESVSDARQAAVEVQVKDEPARSPEAALRAAEFL